MLKSARAGWAFIIHYAQITETVEEKIHSADPLGLVRRPIFDISHCGYKKPQDLSANVSFESFQMPQNYDISLV